MKTLSMISAVLLLAVVAMGQMQHDMHDMAMPSPGDGQFDPYVTSDNKGGFYLAYIEKTGAGSNLMLRHTADGKSYSAPVRINDRPGDAVVRNENPPKLAIGRKGEIYASWANERGKYLGNIRFARSADGGKTFSKAIDLNSDASAPPAGHAFQSLVVDTHGRIYAAWIDERNKKASDRGEEIWISSSDDGGRTFSPNRKILGNVCECCRIAMVVDSQGSLYVSYRSVAPVDPMYRDIVVARSDDGGKTFAPKAVSSDGWDVHACPIAGATMAIDAAGHITVAWFSGRWRTAPPFLHHLHRSRADVRAASRTPCGANSRQARSCRGR